MPGFPEYLTHRGRLRQRDGDSWQNGERKSHHLQAAKMNYLTQSGDAVVIESLTMHLCKKYSPRLVTIHNEIPFQRWTEQDLLADRDQNLSRKAGTQPVCKGGHSSSRIRPCLRSGS